MALAKLFSVEELRQSGSQISSKFRNPEVGEVLFIRFSLEEYTACWFLLTGFDSLAESSASRFFSFGNYLCSC